MSILRTSKFLKHFTSFNRNIVVNRPRDIDAVLIRKSFSVNSIRFLRQAPAQASSIEKTIQKLDQEVRRTGRVNKRELDDAFSELKDSKHASGNQSMMIIRCCGNLLPDESPDFRTKLVKEIWTSLEKMGVPLDISHYNTLIRVYLENEYDFSPTEILSELQKKDIEPNRVTFQLLISGYCQKGDIEGATRILEFMKEKQMPVNESVFSSLINGHFQSGDPQSAVGILSVMKQANIKPSADTYSVLMCGYAKSGDINAIKEVLAQCEAEEVDISDRDLLGVIYSLAVNNHTELIDEILAKVNHTPGYNQDAKNLILRLLVKGQDEAAVKVLRSMIRVSTTDGHAIPVGNFLLRQMVKCNRPLETVLSVCESLKTSGENEYALSVATEASLLNGNPSMSLKYLAKLSEEHELCHHYYWPVLIQYGKQKDSEGLQETLRQMLQYIGQPVSGETLRDFVAPYVTEGEQGVFEIRKGGITIASAAAAMAGHLLSINKLREAADIALKFRANYGSVQLCKLAVSALVHTKDLKSFITFVRAAIGNKEDSDKEMTPVADRIILDAFYSLRQDGKFITELLQAFHDTGIGITNETAEKLQYIIPENKLTPEISTLLSKLSSPDLVLADLERPAPAWKTSNTEQNEASILNAIRAVTSRGDSAMGLKRQLLGYYCVNKELEKAEAYFKELESSGFEFVTGTLVHMLDLYINFEKLPEALEMYKRIFKDPSTTIDSSKVIRLGGLMIKMDKVEDAFELFSKHAVNSDSTEKNFNTNSVAWRLLNSLAERQDPDLLRSVFNKLVETKLMEPNNITLGPLIKVHILRDDVDSALATFEECCQKYRATPWKNEISCKLIQKEDPVSLQRLTDLSTEIHGEINSLYDLVLSFIECGRIRQARKILETPGLRLRNQRIHSACERYTSEGKVNYIENLVEATKDFNHIDRSDLYYHLLTSYCKTGDVDKAFGLWTQMQDEDVPPSDGFLIKLGRLLKEHGRPVPFAIPDGDAKIENEETKVGNTANSDVKELRKIINSKNTDEALDKLSRINEYDLSPGDRSKLINLLIENGRIGEGSKLTIDWVKRGLKPNVRTLSNVLNALAKTGDVDTFCTLGNLLDKELKKLTSFSNRYAHCMVTAGRVDELLKKLENDLKSANSKEDFDRIKEEFPRGGIYSVIDQSAESFAKVEELAALYREKGLLEPSNVVWCYYFIKGNFEKAQEYWNYVKNREKIMFQPIVKHIISTKDVALSWDLINLLKSSENTHMLSAPIYGALIDVEISSGNLPECERILDEALKTFTIDSINRNVVLRLKRNLEAAGKPFKYALGPKKTRQRRQVDTSSSSDSDSDSETAQKSRA